MCECVRARACMPAPGPGAHDIVYDARHERQLRQLSRGYNDGKTERVGIITCKLYTCAMSRVRVRALTHPTRARDHMHMMVVLLLAGMEILR